MESNNKNAYHKIIMVLLLSILSHGCALNEAYLRGDQAFDDYVSEGREKLWEMRKFMGKSRQEVEAAFGKPTGVSSPAMYRKVQYDEEIYYKYDKDPLPLSYNEHYMSFYLNDGKVVAVDAL